MSTHGARDHFSSKQQQVAKYISFTNAVTKLPGMLQEFHRHEHLAKRYAAILLSNMGVAHAA